MRVEELHAGHKLPLLADGGTFVDRKNVTYGVRAPRASERWREPLSAYRGVLSKKERYRVRSRRSSSSGPEKTIVVYAVYLKHSTNSDRDVLLLQTRKKVNLRVETEQFAKLLGVPMLIETGENTYEERAVEDLDKSIAQLAAEGKLDIPAAPEALLKTKNAHSVKTPGGYIFEQTFTTPLIIVGSIAFGIGAGLLYWYFGIGVQGGSGNPKVLPFVGSGFALLGLMFLVAAPLLRLKLEVDSEGVRNTIAMGVFTAMDRYLPASSIEEVRMDSKNGVDIISDQGTAFFGTGLKDPALENIRDSVLATLLKAPAEADDARVRKAPDSKVGTAQMFALAEMNAGRSPSAVFAKLKTQGFQESVIYDAMRRIAGNRATPHASKTGDYLKQLGEQFDPGEKPEMKVGSIVRYYKIVTYVFAAAALIYLLPDLIRHYFP